MRIPLSWGGPRPCLSSLIDLFLFWNLFVSWLNSELVCCLCASFVYVFSLIFEFRFISKVF